MNIKKNKGKFLITSRKFMERYVEETKKLDIKLPKKKLIINENYDQLQKSVSFNVIPTEDNFVKVTLIRI